MSDTEEERSEESLEDKINSLDWEKSELLPVIAQSVEGEVLTLAYMNREALRETMESGYAHYFSRSKGRIRMKGEVSGNVQSVEEIKIDCDEDAVLMAVDQEGPACHTGHRSCFYRELGGPRKTEEKIDYSLNILNELESVIEDRKENIREDSYTSELMKKGREEIYKKVGEEMVEIMIAEKREDITSEAADLIYHLMVLLRYEGIDLGEVMAELRDRRG